jgi:hypothetical protein
MREYAIAILSYCFTHALFSFALFLLGVVLAAGAKVQDGRPAAHHRTSSDT